SPRPRGRDRCPAGQAPLPAGRDEGPYPDRVRSYPPRWGGRNGQRLRWVSVRDNSGPSSSALRGGSPPPRSATTAPVPRGRTSATREDAAAPPIEGDGARLPQPRAADGRRFALVGATCRAAAMPSNGSSSSG